MHCEVLTVQSQLGYIRKNPVVISLPKACQKAIIKIAQACNIALLTAAPNLPE
jgi:hypothetical protein